MKNNNATLLLTLITGTAAGLTIGYLTAPRSGDKTRKRITKELNSTRKNLEKAVSEKIEDYKTQMNQMLEQQANNGKKSIDKMRDKISVS